MPDSDGVLRHIQHAEEWLRWARSDHRRGDTRAVVLRLLLAEAEIRHAREVGTHLAAAPRAVRAPRRRQMAVAGVAVALLLATAAAVTVRPGGRYGPAAVGPSAHAWATEPPGPAGAVQLEAGRLLTLGPTLADGAQGPPEGSSGRSEFRLFPIHGDGAGAPPPAPTDLTLTDGPAGLTTSGDPASSSAAF